MTEKNARILFAVSMIFSFPVVLAVMVSLVDLSSPPRSRPARTLQRPPAALRTPTSRPAPAARVPSSKSQVSPAPKKSSPAVVAAPRPDPEAVQQLAGLRKGLKQEIDALKKDRDTMLATLAQGLAQLSPADAAAELRPLDDELAALTLRTLPASRRQQILSHLEAQRARQIQRRLQALAAR